MTVGISLEILEARRKVAHFLSVESKELTTYKSITNKNVFQEWR